MKPEDPGPIPDAKIRADLQTRFGFVVADAISNLEMALVIDPDYVDAMAYLNLLTREKADLSATTDEYERDMAAADALVKRAMAVIKLKYEQAVQPTALPPPQAVGEPSRVRVGANVMAANLEFKAEPVYPPLAKQAGIQGTVKFHVIIGKDGRPQDVQLLSGHPLLVPAAAEVIQKYVYKPTLLNGSPVVVITQVEVPFVLGN